MSDTRLDALDLAPDQALDLVRPEAARRDVSPDRAIDLPIPDTRPPIPDLAIDRMADQRVPDLRVRETRPDSPDVLPDRPQDWMVPDTRPDRPDLGPDRAQDLPAVDAPVSDLGPDLGPDRPTLDGPVLDSAADRVEDSPALDAAAMDADPDALAGCVLGTPYILALGGDERLYRFDHQTISLTDIKDVTCGDFGLNSLTASPLGPAYISNQGGQLCLLDVGTFETTLTGFDPDLLGGASYGMALLSDSSAAGQTLYIAPNPDVSVELKTINLTSYALGDIGIIDPALSITELTAGPNNGLFALYPSQPSSLLRLDPLTANSLEVVTLPSVVSPGGFALVTWEDTIYLFMGDDTDASANNVYRYRTSDGQVTLAGTLPVQLIGAGVTLCR